jgi:hypothetical protein
VRHARRHARDPRRMGLCFSEKHVAKLQQDAKQMRPIWLPQFSHKHERDFDPAIPRDVARSIAHSIYARRATAMLLAAINGC